MTRIKQDRIRIYSRESMRNNVIDVNVSNLDVVSGPFVHCSSFVSNLHYKLIEYDDHLLTL